MRIGYYTDTYRRTAEGWRLHTRSMTFLRKSGRATPDEPTTRRGPRPAPVEPGPHRAWSSTQFRADLDAWLDDHQAELVADYVGSGTLDQQMAQLAKVKRLTFDAGWMRYGWPERVGGPRRLDPAARLPRRGPDVARPGRTRPLLDDRGAGARR